MSRWVKYTWSDIFWDFKLPSYLLVLCCKRSLKPFIMNCETGNEHQKRHHIKKALKMFHELLPCMNFALIKMSLKRTFPVHVKCFKLNCWHGVRKKRICNVWKRRGTTYDFRMEKVFIPALGREGKQKGINIHYKSVCGCCCYIFNKQFFLFPSKKKFNCFDTGI